MRSRCLLATGRPKLRTIFGRPGVDALVPPIALANARRSPGLGPHHRRNQISHARERSAAGCGMNLKRQPPATTARHLVQDRLTDGRVPVGRSRRNFARGSKANALPTTACVIPPSRGVTPPASRLLPWYELCAAAVRKTSTVATSAHQLWLPPSSRTISRCTRRGLRISSVSSVLRLLTAQSPLRHLLQWIRQQTTCLLR